MTKKLGMKSAIEAMKVGDEISFPVEKLCSVRTTASTAALVLKRSYTTNINRSERSVKVTRIN